MSDYLTVPEAAQYLRISVRKVYDLVSRSRLPHRRAGGRLLFERNALADWVRSSGGAFGMAAPPVVMAGSHDALMDWAVRASRSTLAALCRGSRDGLERIRRREASAALLHLPGPDLAPGAHGRVAGAFNIAAVAEDFAGHDVVLLNWCWRQQGTRLWRVPPADGGLVQRAVQGVGCQGSGACGSDASRSWHVRPRIRAGSWFAAAMGPGAPSRSALRDARRPECWVRPRTSPGGS